MKKKKLIIVLFLFWQNWYNEIGKWLKGKLNSCPIDGGTREEIKAKLNNFMGNKEESWLKRRAGVEEEPMFQVLIISYETFRLYADILQSKPVGLVLCDEVRKTIKRN